MFTACALLTFAKTLEGFELVKQEDILDAKGQKTGKTERYYKFNTTEQQAKFDEYEKEIRRIFDYINNGVFEMNQANPIRVKQDRTGVPTEKNPAGITIFPEDRNIQFERD